MNISVTQLLYYCTGSYTSSVQRWQYYKWAF